MKTLRPILATRLTVIAICVFVAGCSSLKWPVTPVEDIVQTRKLRKEEALEQFSHRRDRAEFQAAINSWNHGENEQCRESLQRLLARNPRHVEAHVLLAKLYEQDGLTEEALTQIKESLVIEPQNENLIAERDSLLEQIRSDNVKQVGYAEISGNSDSTTAAQFLADGEAALSHGNVYVAIDLFNKAVLAAGDPQIPISAALVALRLNYADVAVEVAEMAMDRYGDSAALARILGMAYYRSGDYESSQVVLQQALSLDNTSALTYFLQGCTLTKLGKIDEAQACLLRAREIDPRYALDCSPEKTIRR